MRGVVVALERHGDVDLQREAGRGGVQPGDDGAHDAGLLEAADAVQRGGGGEADEPRELDVRAVRVGLQLRQQLDVNGIK